MSTQITPQKNLSSIHRSNTQNNNENSNFQDKIKQLKVVLASLLPEDSHNEVFSHLQELHQIHLAQLQRQKTKNSKELAHPLQQKVSKSEKKILEVRQGYKVVNDVKIEEQVKRKSPQKKGQQKKFIKFEPKKANRGDSPARLGNILKNGSHV